MSSGDKKTKEKSSATSGNGRRRMKGYHKFLLILISLILMALLRTGFVFFVVAMLPSIVVYYFDQSQYRHTFRTILYCNLAGVLPFLARLLHHGPSSSILQEVMGSASTWMIIYGASTMGGILIAITPKIARSMIDSLHQTQIARLVRSQKKIEQEWGKEVAKFGAHSDGDA